MSSIFIPQKIRVGFVKREETYTGKLAYIIYYDEKNKIRKETSWNNWRDHNIEPIEFENKPQLGYILNKGVQRDGYWGSGRSVIRIYDPREFEFEINIDNLISILMHSNVSKRDIDQECILAWHGKELILLPTNSVEYQQSLKYTEKQKMNISTKDLIKGATYNLKKTNDTLTYIGQYHWYSIDRYDNSVFQKNHGKKHVFYSNDSQKYVIPSTGIIASCINEEPCLNYAQLVENFFNTENAQKIVDIKLDNDFYHIDKDLEYLSIKPILLQLENEVFLCSFSYSALRGNFKTTLNIHQPGGYSLEKINFNKNINFSFNTYHLYNFLKVKLLEYYNNDIAQNECQKTTKKAVITIFYNNSFNLGFNTIKEMKEFFDSLKEVELNRIKLIFENNNILPWSL